MFEEYKEVANQWIYQTHYPHYKDFEVMFDKIISDDESHGTTTVSGEQITIPEHVPEYKEIRQKFFNWLENQMSFKNICYFKCIKSWIISYDKGGYQGLHVHTGDPNYNTFSAVIHLDDIQPHDKNKFNGMLFTLMPETDGFQHPNHFQSKPGGVVCLDGRVWHGVYPTDTSRRTVVYDIEFARN